MASGTIFIIIVVFSFIVFATQAGAKESKFMSSPIAAIAFLAVMGAIAYFVWYSGSGVIFTH